QTFKRTSQVEVSSHRDLVADLPDVGQLEQFIQSARSRQFGDRTEFTLLTIEVPGLQQLALSHGRNVRDDVLRHVVSQTRNALRLADGLFRVGSDDLVAFLNQADEETARAIADRIRDSIVENTAPLRNLALTVNIEVVRVPAAARGQSLQDLFEKVRPRGRG